MKGEDGMIVNQERDCDGRAKNGTNLGRNIPQTHLPFKKLGIYLPSIYRQAPGRHITTFRNSIILCRST